MTDWTDNKPTLGGSYTVPKALLRAAVREFGAHLWCWAPVESVGQWYMAIALANVGGGWWITDRVFVDEPTAYRAAARYNAARGIDRDTMERIRASVTATPFRHMKVKLPKAIEYRPHLSQDSHHRNQAECESTGTDAPLSFPFDLPEDDEAEAERKLAGCYWAWSVVKLFGGWGLCAVAANRAGIYISDERLGRVNNHFSHMTMQPHVTMAA